MCGDSVHLWEESGLAQDQGIVTIDKLPDDVLMEVFNFHENVGDLPCWETQRNTWHTLVHVCHRWRCLVFASPRHLNLRLAYRGHRPMSEVLDAWPVLAVSLVSFIDQSDQQWDNIVAALESEHYDRISEIYMHGITNSRWERVVAAMQKPFPELTHLELQVWTSVERVPFLGGSAPRLRTLYLENIFFPSISKFLLSVNGLVTLSVVGIPDSGYSPDEMVTALTAMTRLESLTLVLHFPRTRPNPANRPLPPLTRFVLPALTKLEFGGVHEYLEDLLVRIDAPLLDYLSVVFFRDLDFDVSQLHRLIGHAEEFKTFDRAVVLIFYESIQLSLYPNTGSVDGRKRLELQIEAYKLNHQLSSLCQVCSLTFPLISALEELQIREGDSLSSSDWKDDIEGAQWLELLDPFTALKNLYLTDGIAQRFCGALQELSGERTTEVLPALHNLFVRGPSLESVEEVMKPFVTARQLSGHPVVLDYWKD